MTQSRRSFLAQAMAGAGAGLAAPSLTRAPAKSADWESLSRQFQMPDWFPDAKLGLWSHWGPQCVPEFGDWYGRLMYVQGHPAYEYHLKNYGHPSQSGFMDFIPRWKIDQWDPADLVQRYKAAGARYIVSMANHHDNLDMFTSRHHPWNTARLGPRRDIVGTWEREVRKAGLRFGVSNHGSHAWHWWQTAYGYDAEGPMKGVRYDAHRLHKADGRGTWWQGLDPQSLYTGGSMVAPDGMDRIADMNSWHDNHDGQWLEMLPPGNGGFAKNWLARQKDLVERYRPDLVYFDNTGLPLEQYGLDAAAHIYDQSIRLHGSNQAVVTGKKLNAAQRTAIVEDVERGFVSGIRAEPWQTCTCIGSWHYDRPLYDRHGYKSAEQVIQRLFDVVSKNGNLLLSIPQRGNGSIDDQEIAILDGMAHWMAINAEAIHGSRPWLRYGEGPTQTGEDMLNEGQAGTFTDLDVRFTTNATALYAGVMKRPVGSLAFTSLGLGALQGGRVEKVELLGHGDVAWQQRDDALYVDFPPPKTDTLVPVLKLSGSAILTAR